MNLNYTPASHIFSKVPLPPWKFFPPEAWQLPVGPISESSVPQFNAFLHVAARSVADVQAAIEHIYPLVYEFKNHRSHHRSQDADREEEREIENLLCRESPEDSEDDFDVEPDKDPLEDPPSKKQCQMKDVRDVSHLTKKFKVEHVAKRPPGKLNDISEDRINVSDDADDPDEV